MRVSELADEEDTRADRPRDNLKRTPDDDYIGPHDCSASEREGSAQVARRTSVDIPHGCDRTTDGGCRRGARPRPARQAARLGALESASRRSRCGCSTTNPDAVIDQAWWDERIASAIARRVPLEDHTNALQAGARRGRWMSVARLRSLRRMARRAVHERGARAIPGRDQSLRCARWPSRPGFWRATTFRSARRKGCRGRPSCCTATFRARSKSTSTASDFSPRRGPDRRPARSSIRGRTGTSSAPWREGARSTASATTARSRCIWRGRQPT